MSRTTARRGWRAICRGLIRGQFWDRTAWPAPGVSLSELRRMAEQRGLQLVVADGLAVLDGATVVHRAAVLAEVAGWLAVAQPSRE